MAITRTAIGVKNSKVGALSQGVSGILPGDVLIVCRAGDTGAASGYPRYIYNDAGNFETFTIDVTATNTGNVITEIASLVVTNASSGLNPRVVGSSGASDSCAMAVIKLQGMSSIPFDKASSGTGSGTSPSSGATATLSQADEICIGAVGTEGPVEDTAGTWSNSFNDGQRDGTTGGGAASNITVSEGYLIVSATTAQTAAKTGITSRDWAAAIATYMQAAPAGATWPGWEGGGWF